MATEENLKALEEKLSRLIQLTNNSELGYTFSQWQEERDKLNNSENEEKESIKEYKGKLYSREYFDEYKTRFKVVFEVLYILPDSSKVSYEAQMDIYSTTESERELNEFIEEKRTEKVLQFSIVHSTTREQDEKTSELIDEFLNELDNGDND